MANQTDAHVAAARRLLLQESVEGGDCATATARVYDLLSDQLAPVLGDAGVRALVTRCVKLNKVDHSSLHAVRVRAQSGEDTEIAQEIVRVLRDLDRAAAMEVATAIFATFFALLTTFIGERLTWQIVQRAFTEEDEGAEETE